MISLIYKKIMKNFFRSTPNKKATKILVARYNYSDKLFYQS